MFSAVYPTTDIAKILRHVRFVPILEVAERVFLSKRALRPKALPVSMNPNPWGHSVHAKGPPPEAATAFWRRSSECNFDRQVNGGAGRAFTAPRPDAPEVRRDLAPHSMSSSALARSCGGMVRPSALAVVRLITSSNLVGCMTGRSAGWAPFRIFPT